MLSYRNLYLYFKEDIANPEGSSEWTEGDMEAMAVIVISLSNEHLAHVQGLTTAREMSVSVFDSYEKHKFGHKLTEIRKIYSTSMEDGESIIEFINRVRTLKMTL